MLYQLRYKYDIKYQMNQIFIIKIVLVNIHDIYQIITLETHEHYLCCYMTICEFHSSQYCLGMSSRSLQFILYLKYLKCTTLHSYNCVIMKYDAI